jgi:hypothetical protein
MRRVWRQFPTIARCGVTRFFAFQKLIIIQFISKADQDLLYFETISMFVASILCEPKIRKTKR